MTEVVSMNVTATRHRLPRLFKFIRVRLSRKLWGTYRVRLGNIVSRTLAGLLLGIGLPVLAGPTGGQVAIGQAKISAPTAQSTVVNQATPKAVINWQSFGIAGNESVRFVQPSSSSVTLNRIVGNDASRIFGSLTANGQVFLVNPQGVYFAPSAQVDAGALVASSLSLSDGDFSAGRYRFGSVGGGEVRNDGRISVGKGGYVVLAAPQVANTGAIEADGGSVALAAGSRVLLDVAGDRLVSFMVDEAALRASVANAGSIQANGGAVALVANALDGALATVVNQSGLIRANSVAEHNGVVTLRAIGGDTVVSGVIDVSGSGAGQSGGSVKVLGDRVGLFGHAAIDASGAAGGGTVWVGGAPQGKGSVPNASQTVVGADASITADATTVGKGGTVIVWADGQTAFNGIISARGGATGGDGGFVETSGKQGLSISSGRVTASAKAGLAGTWLLDPRDINVVTGGAAAATDVDQFSDTPSIDQSIAPATLDAAGTTVVLQAEHDIAFSNAVTLTAPNAGLTAQAGHSITVAVGAAITTNNGVISLSAVDPQATSPDLSGVLQVFAPLSSGTAGVVLQTAGTAGIALSSAITAGQLTMTANNAPLTQSGTSLLAISGPTTLSAGTGNILLTNSTPVNNFVGPVTATGNDVKLADATGGIVLGTTTAGGVLEVTSTGGAITQSGSAVSVTGITTLTARSAGAPSDINLGTITTNNFVGAVNIDGAAVSLADGAGGIVLGTSTATGTFDVASTGGAITQSGGAVSVTGITTLTARSAGAPSDINLGTITTNDFVGAVNTDGAAVSLADGAGGIVLGTSTATGTFDVASTGGAITQSGGAVSVTGITTLTATSAGVPAAITLGTATTSFTGAVNSNGSNINLAAGPGGIVLGATTTAPTTGILDVTSYGGSISQAAGAAGLLTVGSTSHFTVDGGISKDVLLASADNNFTGTITVVALNGGSLRDVSLRNVNATADTTKPSLPATSLRNLDLQFTQAPVNLPAVTLSGNLNVVAGSNITEAAGGVKVAGLTALNAGVNDITLVDPGTDFGGAVSSIGRNVSLFDAANGIVLGASTVSGTLNVASFGGSITQAGALTVGGTSAFTIDTSGDQDVLLASADNNFTGPITVGVVNGGSLRDVSLRNVNVTADTTKPSLPVATLRNLDLEFPNAAVTLPTITLSGTLDVLAGGDVTQAGAISVANNVTTIKANTATIDVDLSTNGAANELKSVSLQSVNGGKFAAVSVTDKDTLKDKLTIGGPGTTIDTSALSTFAGDGTTGSGQTVLSGGAYNSLTLQSKGDISQTGAISVANVTIKADSNGVPTTPIAVDLSIAGATNELQAVSLQSVNGGKFAAVSVTDKDTLKDKLTIGGPGTTIDTSALSTFAGDGTTGSGQTVLSGGAYNSLTLQSKGDISQTGAISVANVTIKADSNGVPTTPIAVDLSIAGATNELQAVSLQSVNGGKFAAVSVTDKDTLKDKLTIGGLGTTRADTSLSTFTGDGTTGSGQTVLSGGAYNSLTLQSKGDISQTGAISVANVTTIKADTATINVDLTNGGGTDNELKVVDLQFVPATTGKFAAVSVTDKDTLKDGLTIGGLGTTRADTSLSTFTGDGTTGSGQTVLSGGAYNSLTLQSKGDISQTGAISVANLTIKADSNGVLTTPIAVDLSIAGATNELQAVSLQSVNGGKFAAVSVTDKDTLKDGLTIGGLGTTRTDTSLSTFTGDGTTGSGKTVLSGGAYNSLTLQSKGDINQTGAISVANVTTIKVDSNGTPTTPIAVDLSTNGTTNELQAVSLQSVNGGKFAAVSVTDKDTLKDKLTIGGPGTTIDTSALSTFTGDGTTGSGQTVLSGGAYNSLTLQSKGDISQTGAISVANVTTIKADTATINVDLTNGGGTDNELKVVDLQFVPATTGKFAAVSVTDKDTLKDGLAIGGPGTTIDTSALSTFTGDGTTGSGQTVLSGGKYSSLTLQSKGNISQTDAISVANVTTIKADTATLTVDLTNGGGTDNELKVVDLQFVPATTGKFAAVSVTDKDTLKDGLTIGGPGTTIDTSALSTFTGDGTTGSGQTVLSGGAYNSLTLQSKGDISQTGAISVANVTIKADSNGVPTTPIAVDLSIAGATNELQAVSLQSVNGGKFAAVSVTDKDTLKDKLTIGGPGTTIDTSALSTFAGDGTTGSGQTVLSGGAYNSLTLQSKGDISQTGAISVANVTIKADSNGVPTTPIAVDLSIAGATNELQAVSLQSVNGGKFAAVSVTDKDTLKDKLTIGGLGTTRADTSLSTFTGDGTTGSGQTVLSGGAYNSLTLQSKGDISQTGAISVANVTTIKADTATINVDLTNGGGTDNELKVVDLQFVPATTGKFAAVSVTDKDTLKDGLAIGGNGTTQADTNLSVISGDPSIAGSGLVVLSGGDYKNLTVQSVGALALASPLPPSVSQTAAVRVAETTTLIAQTAPGDIRLDDPANDFNHITFIGRNVTIFDANSIDILSGQSLIDTWVQVPLDVVGEVGHELKVSGPITAGGGIALDARGATLTINANLDAANDIVLGATTFSQAAGTDISAVGGLGMIGAAVPTQARYGEIAYIGGSFSWVGTKISIGGAYVPLANLGVTGITSSGDVSLTATVSGIKQSTNANLMVDGTTRLAVPIDQSISLPNVDNRLTGPVSILAVDADVELRVNGNLILDGSTARNLNLTTHGDVSQVGAISVADTTTINVDTKLVNVDLTTHGEANELNIVNLLALPGTATIGTFGNVSVTDKDTLGNKLTIGGTGTTREESNLSVFSGDLLTPGSGQVVLSGGSYHSLSVTTTNADLTQSLLPLVVATTTTVNVGLGSVTLATESNDFQGPVSVTGVAAATVSDANDLDIGFFGTGLTTAKAGGALSAHLDNTGSTSLSGGSVSTDGSSALLDIGSGSTTTFGETVTGSLNVHGVNDVLQIGSLTVANTSSLTTDGDITLDNAGNDFVGTVTATGVTVSLSDKSSLTAGLTASGAAALLAVQDISATGSAASLTASGANVSSSVATVGDSTLTAGANGAVNNAADVGGTLTTLGGPTTVSGTLGALNATSSTLSFGDTRVNANASVEATGAVTQTAALTVSGTTDIDAGANAITLDNAGNDFVGTVTATGVTVSLSDKSSLTAGLTASGAAALLAVQDISATGSAASLTASGANVSSSVATVGDSTLTAGANGAVNNAADVGGTLTTLGGPTTVSGTLGALNATSSTLSFGDTRVNANASVEATGAVTQTAALTVSGTTDIDAGANAITLDNAGNDFVGTVTATGVTVSLSDKSSLTAGLTASGAAALLAVQDISATGSAASLTASGANVSSSVATVGDSTLTAGANGAVNNAADVGGTLTTLGGPTTVSGTLGALNATSSTLSFGDTRVNANASVEATGAVTQTAALTVSGTTDIDAGANAITLDNAGNDFVGTVTATGVTVSLSDKSSLTAGLTASGAAALLAVQDISATGSAASLTASGANVSSSVATVGDSTLTAGANGAVNNAADVGGTLTTLGGPTTVSGTLGALNATSSTLSFGDTRVNANLSAIVTQDVKQTAALKVGTSALIESTAGSIALNNAGNDFIGTVTATAAVDAAVTDANSLTVVLDAGKAGSATAGENSLTVSGRTGGDLTTSSGGSTTFGATTVGAALSATGAGNMTQSGALVVSGTTTVNAKAGSVTFDDANNKFTGAFSSTGNGAVAIDNSIATVLGAIGSSAGGAATLDVDSPNGTVTQTDAARVKGVANIDAGKSSITLDNPANDIADIATFSGSGLKYFTTKTTYVNVTGITGDASITTAGPTIKLYGDYFNGTSMELTSTTATAAVGITLEKDIPGLYQLGENVNFVLTDQPTRQDLLRFFSSAKGSTLIDKVPFSALEQLRALASAGTAATVADEERRERDRAAGIGRVKDGIRLNSLTFEEMVAPLSYKNFEARQALCAKEQAEGKIGSGECK